MPCLASMVSSLPTTISSSTPPRPEGDVSLIIEKALPLLGVENPLTWTVNLMMLPFSMGQKGMAVIEPVAATEVANFMAATRWVLNTWS